jgi:hypothetical protein
MYSIMLQDYDRATGPTKTGCNRSCTGLVFLVYMRQPATDVSRICGNCNRGPVFKSPGPVELRSFFGPATGL